MVLVGPIFSAIGQKKRQGRRQDAIQKSGTCRVESRKILIMMLIDVVSSAFYKKEIGWKRKRDTEVRQMQSWMEIIINDGVDWSYLSLQLEDQDRGCVAEGDPDQENPGECFSIRMRPFCICPMGILLFDRVIRCLIKAKSNAHRDAAHLAVLVCSEVPLGPVWDFGRYSLVESEVWVTPGPELDAGGSFKRTSRPDMKLKCNTVSGVADRPAESADTDSDAQVWKQSS